jgi:hypothetical protein
MNESEEIEKIIASGIDAIHNNSNPLFHGKNVNNRLFFLKFTSIINFCVLFLDT